MIAWSKSAAALFIGAAVAAVGLILVAPDAVPLLVLNGSVYPLSKESPRSLRRSIEDAVHIRARQLLNHQVHLSASLDSFAHSASFLGYSIDEAGTVRSVEARVRQRFQADGVQRRFLSRFGRPLVLRVELSPTLDLAVAERALRDLAPLIDRPPVDAQLLIAEHEIVPSQPGQRLSVSQSALRLAHNIELTERSIELSVTELAPAVSEAQLAPVDVTRVLASYETSFKRKAGARAVNIRTAARYLNGALLLPGEVLSFNEFVGRRIHGRGFVDAPVIVNDEMEQDVGGGVCQVASTLHAAAILGNLEVVSRRSHSRPSGYAPLGLDATVIDGSVDLKLRNPYDEPLLVHVSFPSQFTVRVELLGRLPSVRVTHEYAITHREPFARRIWHRTELSEGTFEQKQKGSEGMDVVSVLRILYPDGKVAKKSYTSKYYPVPEVFWLGEGTLQAQLPASDANVAQIVIDGEELETLQ